MSVTLIRGRNVICGVEDAGDVRQIDDGAVLIHDGEITAVGTFAELESAAQGADVLGGSDYVVFPGFVNSHHHVGLTPLQLGSPDLPLELWLADRIRARKVDLYLDTLYSAFQLVRSGVTTVQHLHNRVPGGIEDVRKGADQVIRAYQDLGMRVSYSYGIRDQNRLVYEADEDFLARLPEDLAADLAPYLSALSLPLEDNFTLFEALCDAYADDPLVSIQLAPVNLHWCSDEALERVADVSSRKAVPIHMHLLETPYQKVYARRRTNGSAVRHLERMGLLGPLMTLGHGVWMTEADLDLVSGTDTRVCHNCSSNMRLRSGTAPLNAMIARGIKVAIGIDEAGINDDRDMLQEVRQVLRIHRVPGVGARVPTAAEVFRMATEHGGQTTGFGERIGRIEAGRSADLVLVRWAQIAHPYLDPDVPVLDAVLQRARSEGVDTVLVAGEAILKDGRFTRVDDQNAVDELARSLSGPLSEDEVLRRSIAERVMPHAKSFYKDYLGGETFEPYEHRNSRS
ncbi:MAG: amidohydrolase family protein [Proteobacteria bacterium]|nr:amidohydrolase family protein [Pseudomonadota bacterium]